MKPVNTMRCLISTLVLSAGIVAQHEEPYSDLYVFGDSLSDNGNLFAMAGIPGEPYWEGRFSNGRVWVEQLASSIDLDPDSIQNFAVGGSTTGDVFAGQIATALVINGGQLPSDALYVYWAGANDLLNLLAGAPVDPQVVIGNAMAQTAAAISDLVQAGARHILVPNLPNLSLTPRVIAMNDPVASGGVEALSQGYNQALAFTIAQLEMAFGFDIVEVDMFGVTNAITSNPHEYMLRSATETLLREDGTQHRRAVSFLFFDDIHPTTAGHRLLMREGLTALGMDIPGDVNGDTVVNTRDLRALMWSLGPCGVDCPGDLNQDGFINREDLRILGKMLLKV
ncbi:MAG: SGNH/GDSL hydrolase family protein [Planctomycetota bacterium]|jgi:outer membrane lipase/esterase